MQNTRTMEHKPVALSYFVGARAADLKEANLIEHSPHLELDSRSNSQSIHILLRNPEVLLLYR